MRVRDQLRGVVVRSATVESWINTSIAMTADTATAAIDGVTGAATKTLEISEAGLLVGTRKLVRFGSSDDEGEESPPRRSTSGSPDSFVRSQVENVGRISTSVVQSTFGGACEAVEGVGAASKTAVRGSASAL